MHPGNSLRRGAGTCSIAVAAALCALLPSSALAAVGQGDLSPRLAELARPAVRSASPRAQAKALSLAVNGPGSLVRDGNRVLAQARFARGAAAITKGLRRAGAAVIGVNSDYRVITLGVKPAELRALNGVAGIAGVRPLLRPFTAESTCPSGVAVSEGVRQLHAGDGEYEVESEVTQDEARKAFGVDGSGVTVGILSDSFDQATEDAEGDEPVATHEAEDVESGDLPGVGNTCLEPVQAVPVNVLDDSEAEGGDEGRAMAQIVHDVAPGADLAFATAFTPDMFGFAENIEKLAEPIGSGGAEANVIADDVAFFEEPFFQEGPVGNAIRKVTEDDGVTYLSAAGNDNLFDSSGNEIGSWEAAAFRDSGSCPPAVVAFSQQIEGEGGSGLHPTRCMDFDPGAGVDRTFGIKVLPGATLRVDLQWAEPWNGVLTDLDAYLLSSTGDLVALSVEDNVGSTQLPFEFVQWENESSATQTVQLVVNRFSGNLPRLKFGLLENGSGVSGTEYPRSTGTDVVGPTVYGHAGSADAVAVGATPFNNSGKVEAYSSRGPVTRYFEPVKEGAEAAGELPAPEVTPKPDVVATDCGVTTFFAFKAGANWRFCGTSAAAPHAAGVAALMLDNTETATPADVRSALLAGARPLAEVGDCAQGDGLVDAVAAIEALESSATPAAPECSPPAPVASVEEAQAPGDWGSETPPAGPPVTPPANPPASPPASPPAAPTPPGPTTTSTPSPRTLIRRAPSKTIRTRHGAARAVFRFGSDQGDVTFLCKIDRGRFHRCAAKFVRFYRLGRHVLRVKARNAEGRTDATPFVYRFRVVALRARHSRR